MIRLVSRSDSICYSICKFKTFSRWSHLRTPANRVGEGQEGKGGERGEGCKNYRDGANVWWKLHDSNFKRFDWSTRVTDMQTDGRTDERCVYAIARPSVCLHVRHTGGSVKTLWLSLTVDEFCCVMGTKITYSSVCFLSFNLHDRMKISGEAWEARPPLASP